MTQNTLVPAGAGDVSATDNEALLETYQLRQEEVLAPALGICCCGHVDALHAFVAGLAHQIAKGNAPIWVLEAGARDAPQLYAEVFLHQLDAFGLLMHGGSIGGAWGVAGSDLALPQSSGDVGLAQPLDRAALSKEMLEMVQATLQDQAPGMPMKACKDWIERNPEGAARLFHAFLAEREILDPALFGSQLTELGTTIALLPQLSWRDFI